MHVHGQYIHTCMRFPSGSIVLCRITCHTVGSNHGDLNNACILNIDASLFSLGFTVRMMIICSLLSQHSIYTVRCVEHIHGGCSYKQETLTSFERMVS